MDELDKGSRPTYFEVFPKRISKQKAFLEASSKIKAMSRVNNILRQNLHTVREHVNSTKKLVKGSLNKMDKKTTGFTSNPNFKTIDYVQYNKEALFNLNSLKKRPLADVKWTRDMRASSRAIKPLSGRWTSSPDMALRSSQINFKSLTKDVDIKASYKYCDNCYKTGEFIHLKRYAGRSQSIQNKSPIF